MYFGKIWCRLHQFPFNKMYLNLSAKWWPFGGEFTLITRFMGPIWGWAGPRWAPCWPHEFCYLGKESGSCPLPYCGYCTQFPPTKLAARLTVVIAGDDFIEENASKDQFVIRRTNPWHTHNIRIEKYRNVGGHFQVVSISMFKGKFGHENKFLSTVPLCRETADGSLVTQGGGY